MVAVATNRPACGAAEALRGSVAFRWPSPQRQFASAAERDAAMRISSRARALSSWSMPAMTASTPMDCGAFKNRIVNVHPSLLPEFGGGMDAIEQALLAGAKKTGATVHVVTSDLDAGPILIQEEVPVHNGDTPETLRARVHEAEHRILPKAIRLMEARLAKSSAVR